jgi:NADH-quinone oxidoreductase subunit L
LLEHPEVLAFNPVPLLTSLVVALGGLYLGWLVYRNLPAGARDPLEEAVPSIHGVLKNKYYFDEIYDVLFVRPAYWISETFTSAWMDRGVIDGFMHWVAMVSGMIGNALRNYIDKPIINGFGDLVGESVKRFGRTFRSIQTGRIQQYMIGALFTLAFFSVLFYYLVFTR